jgi:hypothetical protein
MSYQPTVDWTLPGTTGSRTVWAKWRDTAGNWSEATSDTIVLDASPPVIAAGTPVVTPSGTVGGATPVRLSWAGRDLGTGVAEYQIGTSIDDGPWVTVASTTTTQLTQSLSPGHTYMFRVSATDVAGNHGRWRSVGPFSATVAPETTSRATYSGTWSTISSTGYTDGKARRTSAANARVSYAFTGIAAAWVATKGPAFGSVKVYIDGTYATTIDLHRSTTLNRQIVFSRTWAVAGPHTLTLVNVASSKHPYANVDGFISFDGLPRGSISARR